VVPPGILLSDHLQVLASAVEPIVVEEYCLVAFQRLHELAVEIDQAVTPVNLRVPDGIPLLAIAIGTVAPPELGKQRKVLVIDQGDLTLRK
jgi:hypothetical protein